MKTLTDVLNESILMESNLPKANDFYKDTLQGNHGEIHAVAVNFECKDLLSPYINQLQTHKSGDWLGIKAKIEHGQVYYYFYKNEGMNAQDLVFIKADFDSFNLDSKKARKGVLAYFKEINNNPDVIASLVSDANSAKRSWY